MNLAAAVRLFKDRSVHPFRRARFRNLLRQLHRTLAAGSKPSQAMVASLAKQWGNEAWSAQPEVLMALLKWAPQTRGAMLECGSGLSTAVLATLAEVADRELVSLEHDAAWSERVQAEIPGKLRRHAAVALTPLRRYTEFDWYAVDGVDLPGNLGFVFCDGPPGHTFGGRYGLASVLRDRFAQDCTILLDDTERPEERAIVGRWCAELPGRIVEQGPTFSVLQVQHSPTRQPSAAAS